MNIKIMLCIPVYNEAPVIDLLIQEILTLKNKLPYLHIVIINDSSDDGSCQALESLEYHGVEVVRHIKRKGVGGCIETGILKAKEKMFSHVCVWPGNLRIRSDSVFELITFSMPKFDVYVHGARFIRPTNTPLHRKATIFIFSKIASIASKEELTDISCGLRYFPVSMVDEKTLCALCNSKYRGEQILTIRALAEGLRIREFGISLLYDESRNYSHLRFHNATQIISPWVSLLAKNILSWASNKLLHTEKLLAVLPISR